MANRPTQDQPAVPERPSEGTIESEAAAVQRSSGERSSGENLIRRVIQVQQSFGEAGSGDRSSSAEQQPEKGKDVVADSRPALFRVPGVIPEANSAPALLAKGLAEVGLPSNGAPKPNPAPPEGAETVERIVEMAALQRKADSNHMQVLLRDSDLGRLAVRLVERAGLIDTLVRADSPRTSAMIHENLPSLFESLTQRGLQASQSSDASGSGGQQDMPQQHGGRQRQLRAPFRPGQYKGKPSQEFRVQVESVQ